MIIPTTTLLQEVQDYVEAFYHRFQRAELLYHNIHHTENVVRRSCEICDCYSLRETDRFILLAAAWFHDTGQLFGSPVNHEERSVIIMKDFMDDKIADETIIHAIEGCIIATKLANDPHTFLEEIICDADTYNLGTTEFSRTDKLLKKEFELRLNEEMVNWSELTLSFLETHTYFTPYCQSLLNNKKQKNKRLVESRLKLKRKRV